MKYVLGAGISGLLWAFYHPDYGVITDQLGRAVTGADPVVWLNDTDLTRRLLVDLGLPVLPHVRSIGYRYEDWLVRSDEMPQRIADQIFLKKMVPWEAIDAAQAAGIKLSVQTPSRAITKDGGVLRYLDVDVKGVASRLVEEVSKRTKIHVARAKAVYEDVIELDDVHELVYDRLVSTVPAPTFLRLWAGDVPGGWKKPRLHFCPVSFVVSQARPSWWDDRFALVYDADLDSPVSRVGRFGNTWRWEFTGRPDDDVLNDYLPVPNGRFVNPFGRIVQDVVLESPNPKVTFLGRSAEWDYRGLIDRTLERVHGFR